MKACSGVELFAGLVELPEGVGEGEGNPCPEDDEDGGAPGGGEFVPHPEHVAAVLDAEPDGEGVAEQAAEGEGPEELGAGHF